MRITVLGCGRWGSFHGWYADHIGHQVMLWGREGSKHMMGFLENRRNEYLELPKSVQLTQKLSEALDHGEIIVISIDAQHLRSFAEEIKPLRSLWQGKSFVLCMKGLEIGTGKRLTTVLHEVLGEDVIAAVWVGPGHVQDFLKGIPNCMVMTSGNLEDTKRLASVFSGSLIRFYYGKDLLGIEIGAAAKNVIGLAAGMLDGLQYGSLKGALMARGTRELSRLISAMGGDAMTVYGLSHLGDYEATLFSQHSHNRRFGEELIRGGSFGKLAEGVHTVKAMMALSEEHGVELPICQTVYRIVHEGSDPKEELTGLFLRAAKEE